MSSLQAPFGSASAPRDPAEGAVLERQSVYLHPGMIHATSEPTVVSTIVGSCIAVCLWDGPNQIGGVSHYLLPVAEGTDEATGKWGNLAIPELINRLLALGASRRNLKAKIFGGASVMKHLQNSNHLGLRNVDIAVDALGREGIAILARDVAGNRGRRILFYTDNGTTLVKHL